MATTGTTPPRDSGGRFVKRRQSRAGSASASRKSGVGAVQRHTRQLALLAVCMVLGVLGFALSVFWIGSLILMGVLWGTIAMERQRQPGVTKGVLAEVVEVVVDEAKDVADSASHHGGPRHGEPNRSRG